MSRLFLPRCVFGLVKPAQRMIVKKQFQKRVHIPPLGLEFLRHGDEDDFAVVNRRKIERAFLNAEDFRHFGRQEVLQIIADGFADAAKLFRRLVEETIFEMVIQGITARCLQRQFVQKFQFLVQLRLAGKHVQRAG